MYDNDRQKYLRALRVAHVYFQKACECADRLDVSGHETNMKKARRAQDLANRFFKRWRSTWA